MRQYTVDEIRAIFGEYDDRPSRHIIKNIRPDPAKMRIEGILHFYGPSREEIAFWHSDLLDVCTGYLYRWHPYENRKQIVDDRPIRVLCVLG